MATSFSGSVPSLSSMLVWWGWSPARDIMLLSPFILLPLLTCPASPRALGDKGDRVGTADLRTAEPCLKLLSSLLSLMAPEGRVASNGCSGTGVIQWTMARTPPEVAQKA